MTTMTEKEKSQRTMFLFAALFNITVAVLLGFFQATLMPLLGMEALGSEVFLLHLFLAVVFFFGVGYFLVAMNAEGNRNIVWLGMLAKLAVVILLLFHAIEGNVAWMLAALGLGDLLFAVLFARFLIETRGGRF